ncbi:type I restriction enzyme HsdR N-terminal domain-containing protein [Ferruginibacter sp.]|nr:hypothetical protein [Ferruginibacter sp.]
MLNEAEVREKIINPWLVGLAFKQTDIKLESSFSIRLGRGVKSISGKSDYLVKSNTGVNLFIIETKSQLAKLNDDDKNQAISYARLISEGNIPPFSIVTNGLETIIYDSISKEKVTGELAQHPHVKNEFQIECSIAARSEALNCLLALNEQNLHKFCTHQVQYRLRPLKSEDIYSGKKYIPTLYIKRNDPENRLNNLLFDLKNPRRLVLVTGSPQKGKTSFVCNQVENLLLKNINCLFFPAIGLNTGLLNAIKEDFQWVFHDQNDVVHIIQQLENIIKKQKQKLFIFIDELNEIDQKIALLISSECERIASEKIVIVLSATSNSLERLLFEYGNPNFLADQSNITLKEAELLSKKALQNIEDKNVIQINDFNAKELDEAATLYSKAYNVKGYKINILFSNPLLLRVAMELFANKEIPENLNDANLIGESLFLKGSRTGISKTCFQKYILELSEILFKKDSPISDLHSLNIEGIDIQKLYEAAILAELHTTNNKPAIDFYYSRERDYCIAYLLKDWLNIFLKGNKDEVKQYLDDAIQTYVGQEALRWFFSSPSHIQQVIRCVDLFDGVINTEIKNILFYAMLSQDFTSQAQLNWLSEKINKMNEERLLNNSKESIEEAVIILFQFIKGSGINNNRLTRNQLVCLKEIMLIEEKLEGETDVRETFSIQLLQDYNLESDFISLMLDDNNKISSFAALLYVESYRDLIKQLNIWITNKNELFELKYENFIVALEHIKDQMSPDMCDPHQMYSDRDEFCISGYIEFRDDYKSIINLYSQHNISNFFLEELGYLKEYALEAIKKNPKLMEEEWVNEVAPELIDSEIIIFEKFNPQQIKIPFEIKL